MEKYINKYGVVGAHITIYDLETSQNINNYQANKLMKYLINIGNIINYKNRFYISSTDMSEKINDVQCKLLYNARVLLTIAKYLNNNEYNFDKLNLLFINDIHTYSPLTDEFIC